MSRAKQALIIIGHGENLSNNSMFAKLMWLFWLTDCIKDEQVKRPRQVLNQHWRLYCLNTGESMNFRPIDSQEKLKAPLVISPTVEEVEAKRKRRISMSFLLEEYPDRYNDGEVHFWRSLKKSSGLYSQFEFSFSVNYR